MSTDSFQSRASGVIYDLHDLHGSPARDVVIGVLGVDDPGFKIARCVKEDLSQVFYHFMIQEPDGNFVVQIAESHPPHCQCQTSETACKHVFWLVDQLMGAGKQRWGYVPDKIRLTEKGTATQCPNLSGHIRNVSEEYLSNSRGWTITERERTHDEHNADGAAQESLAQRVTKRLFWILEPSPAIEAGFHSCQRNGKPLLRATFREFQKLIVEYAQTDEDFEQKLDAMLTPAFSVTSRLVQIKFDFLETARQFEAIRNPLARNAITVADCAEKLRGHVQDILAVRQDLTSAASTHMWGVFGLLLEILRWVAERNYDVYDGVQGTARGDQNNLYALLIGNARGPHFILEKLIDYSIDDSQPALRSHASSMRMIEVILRANGGNPQYLHDFQNLLRRVM
ncbi:hypothetical protein MPH_10089 [Macrophomina phaseolina MS6]|uniref:SWIM-type domain-containing protein n=2 Tax=Macrophomina phaseolina TaxID=35725 RepID=K2QSK0_MACPH|nr:hypothetical protein MPH_10089 [Macrophomina phaseolina MS6]KAH7020639.1 hypothetical protein B0J12DRAFT_395298 [Macrophomina phaseolina]